MTMMLTKLAILFRVEYAAASPLRFNAVHVFVAVLMIPIVNHSAYGQDYDELYDICIEYAEANYWGQDLLDAVADCDEIIDELEAEAERIEEEMDSIELLPGSSPDSSPQPNPAPCGTLYCPVPPPCYFDVDQPHCKDED